MDELRTSKLRQILVDFHTVTGQHIAIFDTEYRVVAEYPAKQCELCSIIRSDKNGAICCRESDVAGMMAAAKRNAPVAYTCHAGLNEICAPIQDDGEVLGYIMLGQLLTDEDRKAQWSHIKERCQSFDCSMKDLHQAFQKMRQMSPDVLNATSRIMMACVGYIRLEQLMKRQSDLRWQDIQSYIQGHLLTSFTLPEMADALDVSVATICKTVKRISGKTVGQLLLEERVQRAQQYLLNSDRSIAEIAGIVGIEDYNYFTRVFRKQTGITPSQYRRKARQKG